jgi:Ni/Fe-hydrogenase subunit HybB-like protein
MYKPTWVEVAIFMGTFGLFFTLFFLFIRIFPVIALSEVKAIARSSSRKFISKPIKEQLPEKK